MEELALFVGGFVVGVFLRSVFVLDYAAIFFSLLLATILMVVPSLFEGQRRRIYKLGAVFFVLLALGILRMSLADTPMPRVFAAQIKHHVSYQGIVASDPDRRDTEQLVDVSVTQSGEHTKILAIAPLYPEVAVGERVTLSGTLAVPQPFATDDGRTFAYDKYLQKDGARFEIEHAYLDEVAPAPWYSLPAFFARIKHLFLNGIAAALPEPSASLAAGLAIGGKSGLGTALEQSFVLSGLVQLVVLSGYNVMIVAEGAMLFIGALRLSRKWQAIAGALAVILFVLIAGLSSTALRAALMALIALYARATGRSYAASRALLAVIFLMLLWSPLILAYDPGFDLSVAATAGLIWLAPLIEVRLARVPSDSWRVGIATTLAAQAAVLPLLLYDTGNLSLVSIPANLLTMPIVPFAMAAAAIAALAGILLGHFAFIIAFPAYLATSYIIWIARTASALPLAAFAIPAFSFWLVLAAYAALAYIAFAKRSSTTVQLTLSKNAST
jgi:competence protein ComEC